MTLAPDGGGGSVILIDPDSLRTAAGRLKGLAGDLQMIESILSDVAYPDMPPGTYAVVQPAVASSVYSISSEIGPLTDTPTELTRRAFWAEYADRMMSGYVLTGTAKKEFEQWLADGTLLKYASPDEARAAGVELAKVSGDFRKDPRLLLTLAADLKGGETATDQDVRNAFSAGFVNQFGAKNMELVPRVIQAMESSRAFTGSTITDPHALTDVARVWNEQGITLQQLKEDPVNDLLAPFSIALANATYSGQITRTVEDDIADDDDQWATAALLSQGDKFGTRFLLDCFKTGVVNRIVQDSPYHVVGSLEQPPGPEPYDLGWSSGHALPGDTKQIVLDALARNPAAAAQALTEPICAGQVDNAFGQRETVTDPLTLLYQYGHFDDHGQAFGNAYGAATDYLNRPGAGVDSFHQGSLLTQNALNDVLNDPGHPSPDQSSFKDGLAHDLAQHHIKDIFDSLRAGDNDGIGVNGTTPIANSALTPGSLSVSASAFTQIVQRLGDDPSALNTLLHAGATYQGALIDVSTHSTGDTTWVKPIAAFDACVFNGTELHNVDQFNAADARHQAVVGFVKDVTGSVIGLENPVADAIVHNGLDTAIDHAMPGPDPTHVVMQNLNDKVDWRNNLRASITAGYYQHGVITTPPPADIVHDGKLIPYGQLENDSEAKRQYDAWMQSTQVSHVVDPADQQVTDALVKDGVDLF